MRAACFQDRIDRGMGVAARQIGRAHDLYRPRGAADPIRPANRVLRMPAAFNAEDGTFGHARGYGHALWYGVLDAAYLRVGDYLAGPSGTFFVAERAPLLPVLCVQTNRTLSFARPAPPVGAGAVAYGGVTPATARPLLANWPAAVLAGSRSARGTLPADANLPFWSVLLPVLPAAARVTLRSSDLITDDLARTYIVSTAEETALGWRLVAKQAAT